MEVSIWKKPQKEEVSDILKKIKIEIIEGAKEKSLKLKLDYSNLYFYKNPDDALQQKCINEIETPSKLSKSCKWVEDEIYALIDKDEWSVNDVLKILAWKVGKINHKACNDLKENDNRKIQYFDEDNWKEEDLSLDIDFSLCMPNQSAINSDQFLPFVKGINEVRNRYIGDRNIENAWKGLLAKTKENEKVTRGIGTVYLVTLLHFITKCECPIYDRFAMASLIIWKLETCGVSIPIDSTIFICSLPEKKTNKAEKLLDEGSIYKEYIHLLSSFCKENNCIENEWIGNRNIDRALWVFGHFYQVKIK